MNADYPGMAYVLNSTSSQTQTTAYGAQPRDYSSDALCMCPPPPLDAATKARSRVLTIFTIDAHVSPAFLSGMGDAGVRSVKCGPNL